jgi:large subunit ribosomal protein L4
MKINVIDLKGEKLEELNLSDKVFGIEPNKEILKQYVRVYRSNQRQGNASTKTRAEVSGGGKKPWAQKHTGKARSGSTRSPIWVHGGVAFGPKPKSWKLDLSKSAKEVAMKSALSQKATDKKITVLDKVTFKKPNTKEFAKGLEKIKIVGKTLFVWQDKDENLVRSTRNIPTITVAFSGSLSPYDVLDAKNVIFMKSAVLTIEEKLK